MMGNEILIYIIKHPDPFKHAFLIPYSSAAFSF